MWSDFFLQSLRFIWMLSTQVTAMMISGKLCWWTWAGKRWSSSFPQTDLRIKSIWLCGKGLQKNTAVSVIIALSLSGRWTARFLRLSIREEIALPGERNFQNIALRMNGSKGSSLIRSLFRTDGIPFWKMPCSWTRRLRHAALIIQTFRLRIACLRRLIPMTNRTRRQKTRRAGCRRPECCRIVLPLRWKGSGAAGWRQEKNWKSSITSCQNRSFRRISTIQTFSWMRTGISRAYMIST